MWQSRTHSWSWTSIGLGIFRSDICFNNSVLKYPSVGSGWKNGDGVCLFLYIGFLSFTPAYLRCPYEMRATVPFQCLIAPFFALYCLSLSENIVFAFLRHIYILAHMQPVSTNYLDKEDSKLVRRIISLSNSD